MFLFTRKATREAIYLAKRQRALLIQSARVIAHDNKLGYVTAKTGALVIHNQDHTAHIFVDARITKKGRFIPMIAVDSEVPATDQQAEHILELAAMKTPPRELLRELVAEFMIPVPTAAAEDKPA